MICAICNKNLNDCDCPGNAERLRSLAFDANSPVVTKWCRKCDKHHSKCRCAKPDFFYVRGREEINTQTNPALYELLKARDKS